MLLRGVKEQKLETTAPLSVRRKKGLFVLCSVCAICSRISVLHLVLLLQFHGKLMKKLLRVTWPYRNGSLLILCSEASREYVIVLFAFARGKFAKK